MTQEQNNEWYTNKELFEQLQHFRDDFSLLTKDLTKEMYDIREEMTETKMLIKEYNGLRQEIVSVKKDLIVYQKEVQDTIESKLILAKSEQAESKKKIEELKDRLDKAETQLKAIKWTIGTIVAIITFALSIAKAFSLI